MDGFIGIGMLTSGFLILIVYISERLLWRTNEWKYLHRECGWRRKIPS
jgi:hypothetical protein